MYNEIEQLEQSLKKRKPAAEVIDMEPMDIEGDLTTPQASLSYAQQKKIFDMPDATKPTDSNTPRYIPSGAVGGGDKIVGGVDPDYSGYDDLLKKLEGLKPRDTSTADLINMGVSTGIGMLFGRTGTGAKVAGEYGIDRFNKAEKRADSIEDLILQIQAQKAAKMAAGKKGTKLKGGAGVDAYGKAYQNRWRDSNGFLRTPQYQNENGQWVKDDSDPVYDVPTIGFKDQKQTDGTITQVAQMGNQVKTIGGLDPQLKTEKNAKGETVLLNDRTGQISDLGDHFNKTSAGLSPFASTQYKSITDKVNSDPSLRGIKGSYNDMVLGSAALGRGDIGNMKVAVKMLASALEKGRMTSDADVRQVSEMNTGLVNYFENKLNTMKEGDKGIEDVRREMESAFSTLYATIGGAYDRGLSPYQKQAQTMLGKEYHPDLAFQSLPKYGRKEQEKIIDKSMKTAKELMSTGEWVQDLVVDGKPVMRDGRPVRAVFIMKNGKPFAVREAK